MFKGLFKKIVGDSNQRTIARLQKIVEEINALEPEYKALESEQLRGKTEEFRKRLERGETLDDLLIEAFAAVREAARRTIGLRHHDVQLIGGIVLHQGKIAEMRTGEGKTLVATLPLYLNALLGRGAHLVTPNDYLSKVGVQWMGPIYHALGLSVGVIQSAAADPNRGSFLFDPNYPSDDDRFLNLRPVSRRAAYQADITYGTNNEFGFDYLRDNMVRDLSGCVQRELYYAIVDEVDNILIDEARTPLIISGPADESSDLYSRFAEIVPQLKPSSPESVEAEEPDGDYEVDERTQVVTLTERGVERVEQMLGLGKNESIYDKEHSYMLPYLDNALRAHVTYKRDKDYIVKDGEVIIVDEFTGRLMYGRRFSEGLHQAIEAKEGVPVRRESLTYATITFQNYFRMYEKLAGMTGTAKTEEEEFQSIYDLDVVVLPTNVEYRATYGDLVARQRRLDEIEEVRFAGVLNEATEALGMSSDKLTVTTYEHPEGKERRYFKRLDLPDLVYSTARAKFRAVVEEIKRLHDEGRPVLVGTIAIETSEHLSRMLQRRGVPHQVLNAKYHEQEAQIIAQAGRTGAVTIATNMAGRGVDIKLGGDPEGVARERLRKRGFDLTQIRQADWNRAVDLLRRGEEATAAFESEWAEVLSKAFRDCAADREKVLSLGGLHIVGTERHEARRIDNQLRGRAGRQGDPGSSRFYVSLEDELMRRFGGERVQTWMDKFGVEDMPIQHSLLDKTIESAQVRVEGYNFDIRKHVLEYDDVVNKQREVIYAQRREVLSATDLREQVLRMLRREIGKVVATHTSDPDPEFWDVRGLFGELRQFVPLPPDFDYRRWREAAGPEEVVEQVFEMAAWAYDDLGQYIGRESYKAAEREGLKLGDLAQSPNSVQHLIYQRVVERLGREPTPQEAALPLRDLPRELRDIVREAYIATVRLSRDREIILRTVDRLWVRHLTALDALREGIGLRAYGQHDPLVAYRKEAHEMYEDLLAQIQEGVARSLLMVERPQPARQRRPRVNLQAVHPSVTGGGRAAAPTGPSAGAGQQRPLGRNEPCWCGSGKKYKDCHWSEDRKAGQVRMVPVERPVSRQRSPAVAGAGSAPRKKRRRRKR